MGHKVRHLLGYSALFRDATLIFTLAICAHHTFGGIVTSWGPGSGYAPNGYLKVTVDAPDSVKSAIQWSFSPPNWFNNGDTVCVPPGPYYIYFRPIAGWTIPANGYASVSSNSTNIVNFGLCSFVSLGGEDYQGLFSDPSAPNYESSGFCEISGGKSGGKGLTFTGKISSAGGRHSFSGSFSESGNAWTTISRPGASPLSIHMVAGDDTLTGEISSETWTATLLAKRKTFDSRGNPAPQAGKYTFALLAGTNSTSQPGGDSFGTMTVNSSGGVTLATTLSDGTKAIQKTFLSKDGQLPFLMPLYSGKGFVIGWLQLQGQSELNPPKVELYRECNYTGSSCLLTQGDYWTWSGHFYAGTNETGTAVYDTTSGRSMKIPYGLAVTLYTNAYLGGAPFRITTDDPCFVDDGIDVFRSIRVETNGAPPLPDFGTVTWMKPPDARAKHYPAGFTTQVRAFVSKYQSPAQVPVLPYNTGLSIFQSANPSESITNEFSIDSSGRISGPNNLNLRIAPSSGSFKGSIVNPLTGKIISFGGVVLQRQQFARGFFLDGDLSGSVYFGP